MMVLIKLLKLSCLREFPISPTEPAERLISSHLESTCHLRIYLYIQNWPFQAGFGADQLRVGLKRDLALEMNLILRIWIGVDRCSSLELINFRSISGPSSKIKPSGYL